MSEKIFYSEHFYEKGPKDTEALEKNVRDYPFSSLANFLLLYHYKKINHPDFDEQAKKTALLFSNPNWLEFQLNNFVGNGNKTIAENPNASDESKSAEQQETFSDLNTQHVDEETISNEEHVITNIEGVSETANDEIIAEQVPQDNLVEENVSEEARYSEFSQNQYETQTQNTLIEEDSEAEKDVLTFEPLHTVDYFASQGIKLSEDQIKNDKLVNQVKSFTAWLKTMKKIHPSKLEEQSVADEKLIQTSAEVSNIDAEVLTEAMAEVLIKQNKTEKAIEMYTKLSLINPAKSAYFASRIEQIKSTL